MVMWETLHLLKLCYHTALNSRRKAFYGKYAKQMGRPLAGFALHRFLFSNQVIVVHYKFHFYHSYQFATSEIFSGINTSVHVNIELNSVIPLHLNNTLINVFMDGIRMRASWKQMPSALFQFMSVLHEIYSMTCCNSTVGDYSSA